MCTWGMWRRPSTRSHILVWMARSTTSVAMRNLPTCRLARPSRPLARHAAKHAHVAQVAERLVRAIKPEVEDVKKLITLHPVDHAPPLPPAAAGRTSWRAGLPAPWRLIGGDVRRTALSTTSDTTSISTSSARLAGRRRRAPRVPSHLSDVGTPTLPGRSHSRRA